MHQSLKQTRDRIRSIENTKKVTSAMEMVSVAKLNRIDKMFYAMRPYCNGLKSILDGIITSETQTANPFLENRNKKEKFALCLMTSDNGLCGLYNINVMRAAEDFINKNGKANVKLITVGKKGFNYFSNRGLQVLHAYTGLNGRYDQKVCSDVCDILKNLFLSKTVDEVYVAYNRSETGIIYKADVEKFLNIETAHKKDVNYIYEPGFNNILDSIVDKYIVTKMKLIFLEALTLEHSARSIAMRTATDNAKELLEGLILLRNKVRQANITQEILEIISSTEALKG